MRASNISIFEDRRAVSKVAGGMILVAIVVVLAGSTTTMVLSLADTSEPRPNTAVDFEDRQFALSEDPEEVTAEGPVGTVPDMSYRYADWIAVLNPSDLVATPLVDVGDGETVNDEYTETVHEHMPTEVVIRHTAGDDLDSDQLEVRAGDTKIPMACKEDLDVPESGDPDPADVLERPDTFTSGDPIAYYLYADEREFEKTIDNTTYSWEWKPRPPLGMSEFETVSMGSFDPNFTTTEKISLIWESEDGSESHIVAEKEFAEPVYVPVFPDETEVPCLPRRPPSDDS